jgi:23S rRNA (guanine2445-N2)-methyltransferase / 23S rRNA (guanine2069-N7)-methyltransferase
VSERPSAEFVATCTRGAEPLLAAEIRSITGVDAVREERGAVLFAGSLRHGYRLCLWSRLASRVLLILHSFPCRDAEALYRGVRAVRWLEHMGPDETLAVDFVGVSESIRNSRFGALKTKDAICDAIMDRKGRRPSVELSAPDVRINVHLRNEYATLSLDMSGDGLHRRGFDRNTGAAPLKETLAAAILHLADWPTLCHEGVSLVDPMCGSGTILLEAAGIAQDRAPGLQRRRWGFTGWRGHLDQGWQTLLDEARQRARAGADTPVPIFGSDRDRAVLGTAKENAVKAKLNIRLKRRDLSDVEVPPTRSDLPRGLLITNPPFGERLGEFDQAQATYRELGNVLRHKFLGWRGFVLAGSKPLAGAIGLRPSRRVPMWNGPIECRVLQIDVSPDAVQGRGPGWQRQDS